MKEIIIPYGTSVAYFSDKKPTWAKEDNYKLRHSNVEFFFLESNLESISVFMEKHEMDSFVFNNLNIEIDHSSLKTFNLFGKNKGVTYFRVFNSKDIDINIKEKLQICSLFPTKIISYNGFSFFSPGVFLGEKPPGKYWIDIDGVYTEDEWLVKGIIE